MPRPIQAAGSPSPPTARAFVQEIDDPCIWEAESRPWELLAAPFGPGGFHNRKRILITPNLLLYWESFVGGLRVQGMSPAGMLGLTVPLRVGGRSSYWGAALHEQGLPATVPGALDSRLDAGQEHLILLARLDWLRAELDPETGLTLERYAARRVLPVAPRVGGLLGLWLQRLLSRTHAAPEVLTHPAAVSAMERDLLHRLLRILPLAAAAAPLDEPTLRERGFQRAIECLRAADLCDLSAPALCAQVGVSQRTLEYAFREQLGASPMDLVRRMRLHAVRRTLLATERERGTVADIAMRFGFYQLGRFAADYRAVFGELPSATLGRSWGYRGASLMG